MDLLTLGAAFLIGAAVAWLLSAYRSASMRGLNRQEAEALTAQAETLRTEKARGEERALLLEKELQKLSADIAGERGRVIDLSSRLSKSQADYANLEERLRTHSAELEALQQKFTEEFQAVAHRVLLNNSQQIQQQHKDKLDDLLNPLKEKIDRFEKRVEDTHKESIRENQSLKEQISSLQKLNQTIGEEAKNLTTALKGQSKSQGNWGEIILERILERSGLVRGREYTVQVSMEGEDGRRLQPDVVIHLPENKNLVVDAKVSLTAYERFCNTQDEVDRAAYLKEHVSSVRKHLRELSGKNYQALYQLSSLDFVLMFIPIEPAFIEATAADPDLYNEAFEKNIVIVSTSNLFATLRTIASIWRQENQNRNAQEIARQGGELFDKFVGFVDDLTDVGRRIALTQQAYDDAMGKLHTGRGNLVRRAEELRKLGAKTTKVLPQAMLDRDDTEDVAMLSGDPDAG